MVVYIIGFRFNFRLIFFILFRDFFFPDCFNCVTDTSESSTAEAIKNFIKIIDHLLDVLANQEKFNKQIDEINGTNYPAGTIIYVDPDDSSDEESSEKYCVSLEEVVQRIREARSNRNL